MKECPYCAEKIQNKAIKCKHCGEMLNIAKENIVQNKLKKEGSSASLTFGQLFGFWWGCFGGINILRIWIVNGSDAALGWAGIVNGIIFLIPGVLLFYNCKSLTLDNAEEYKPYRKPTKEEEKAQMNAYVFIVIPIIVVIIALIGWLKWEDAKYKENFKAQAEAQDFAGSYWERLEKGKK